jgi:hypothetical protein
MSIRENSFFFNQEASLDKYLSVFYFFAKNVPAHTASDILNGDLSECTLLTWYNLYRDIMSRYLVDNPTMLGGPGEIVEIDESKWSRKSKYQRGDKTSRDGPWIFGMIQRSNSKVYLFIVNRRTREELYPHILRMVRPGTTITVMTGKHIAHSATMSMNTKLLFTSTILLIEQLVHTQTP